MLRTYESLEIIRQILPVSSVCGLFRSLTALVH